MIFEPLYQNRLCIFPEEIRIRGEKADELITDDGKKDVRSIRKGVLLTPIQLGVWA